MLKCSTIYSLSCLEIANCRKLHYPIHIPATGRFGKRQSLPLVSRTIKPYLNVCFFCIRALLVLRDPPWAVASIKWAVTFSIKATIRLPIIFVIPLTMRGARAYCICAHFNGPEICGYDFFLHFHSFNLLLWNVRREPRPRRRRCGRELSDERNGPIFANILQNH